MKTTERTLKNAALSAITVLLGGVCEFILFFILVNISFLPVLFSQTLSSVFGLFGRFVFGKLLKYKDGFSVYKLKTQFPMFLAATLFIVGAGDLLLSVLSFFIDFILLSKAIVSAVTAVSGAFIYKRIFHK